MESKGEQKGGGSLTAVCKLHFSAWECEYNWARESNCVWAWRWRESGKLADRESVKENRKRWKRGGGVGFKWWPEWFYPLSMASRLPHLSQPLQSLLYCKDQWQTLGCRRVLRNLCLSPLKHQVTPVIISSHANQEPIHRPLLTSVTYFSTYTIPWERSAKHQAESWANAHDCSCNKCQNHNQKYFLHLHSKHRDLQYLRAATMARK